MLQFALLVKEYEQQEYGIGKDVDDRVWAGFVAEDDDESECVICKQAITQGWCMTRDEKGERVSCGPRVCQRCVFPIKCPVLVQQDKNRNWSEVCRLLFR